ncbi:transglutaminase-like domain-containing protein [Candidatus Woesearchaeota archaeon]|nr:transglutaminase-like domain-containing protein [Candidatus Woesearchaeota archaeon]
MSRNQDELHNHIQDIESDEPRREWPGPIKFILGFTMIILLILMIIPYWSISADPNPTSIPKIEQVVPDLAPALRTNNTISSRQELQQFIMGNDPFIKQVSNRVVTFACSESDICYAKALFYFVRDNIQYISDPPDEYIETPHEVLYNGGADCDGHAVLLASLLESIGIKTELVFVPGHVFIRAKIEKIPKSYQYNGYVYMDPTCSNCEFGEIPYQYSSLIKSSQ